MSSSSRRHSASATAGRASRVPLSARRVVRDTYGSDGLNHLFRGNESPRSTSTRNTNDYSTTRRDTEELRAHELHMPSVRSRREHSVGASSRVSDRRHGRERDDHHHHRHSDYQSDDHHYDGHHHHHGDQGHHHHEERHHQHLRHHDEPYSRPTSSSMRRSASAGVGLRSHRESTGSRRDDSPERGSTLAAGRGGRGGDKWQPVSPGSYAHNEPYDDWERKAAQATSITKKVRKPIEEDVQRPLGRGGLRSASAGAAIRGYATSEVQRAPSSSRNPAPYDYDSEMERPKTARQPAGERPPWDPSPYAVDTAAYKPPERWGSFAYSSRYRGSPTAPPPDRPDRHRTGSATASHRARLGGRDGFDIPLPSSHRPANPITGDPWYDARDRPHVSVWERTNDITPDIGHPERYAQPRKAPVQRIVPPVNSLFSHGSPFDFNSAPAVSGRRRY